jgi:hypothetical protein
MNYIKQIFLLIVWVLIFINSINTYALSESFYSDTKYSWQWPISERWTPNNSRDTMGMKWSFSNELWLKTKLFTATQWPSVYHSGEDINGDGKVDLIYWYWWKLYLWDTVSWMNLWETKVVDVKELIWVENIIWNWIKSIIVLLWEDRYLWIIDWQTGQLIWTSHFVSWPVKATKISWPWLDWKAFDINNDGINEYQFKQWYNKYHSYHFL